MSCGRLGYPYNSHRYLLRQFEDSITFVEASTDGLSLIDQQGHGGPSASHQRVLR